MARHKEKPANFRKKYMRARGKKYSRQSFQTGTVKSPLLPQAIKFVFQNVLNTLIHSPVQMFQWRHFRLTRLLLFLCTVFLLSHSADVVPVAVFTSARCPGQNGTQPLSSPLNAALLLSRRAAFMARKREGREEGWLTEGCWIFSHKNDDP